MGWWRTVPVAAVLLLPAGCGDQDGTAGRPDPLDGRTFVVTGVTVAGEPYAVVPGTQVRLAFADGTLGISAGCNRLSGDYRLDGDRLTVGPIGGTEMGCARELMDQDAWVAGLFAGPVEVGADAGTLTAGDTVLTTSPDDGPSGAGPG